MKKLFNDRGIITGLTSLILTSCKQTIVVNEAVLVDEPATKTDLCGFIKDSLIDWSFGIWFVVFLLVGLLIWKWGYSILEWYKRKPVSNKVLIAMAILAIIFVISCIPNSQKDEYGGWFALPVMMALGFFIAIFQNLNNRIKQRHKNKKCNEQMPKAVIRQHNLRLLALFMAWIWSCGWVLYFIAIGISYRPHVGSEVFFRSSLASLQLFVMTIDSNIIDSIWSHDVLKGMICCAGVAATICTVILIMLLVVSRLMAYLHINNLAINNQRNHLYIFFDICDASRLLAQNIYDEDPQAVIVYVDNAISNKTEYEDDKTESWRSVLDILSFRRKTIHDIEENDRTAIAMASSDICSITNDTTDVLGNIGLETVKKLMIRLNGLSDAQLHIFLLSEERDTNVRATSILVRDDLIGCKGYKTTVYCHARRDGVNRVLEDLGLSVDSNIVVKILDSAHLAMEYLMRDVENHPVNFVDVETIEDDNPGSVSSEFVSLVMGFGETGQEAVKFLYEYGAFVDKKANEKNSYRSPFSCYVVDNNMQKLEGPFIADVPAAECIKSSAADSKVILSREAIIRFYELDFRSDDFFTTVLKEIANKLNYVVVAVGDDELNMTVAVEILSYVRKHRDNLENFCIYVRAYEKGTFKHLSEIAKHYNKRLAMTEDEIVKKIVLFGQNQEIYTYNLVIRDQYQEKGEKYYETYRSLNLDPANDEGPWNKRHTDTLQKEGTTKWERLSKIRRKENQDRSNALHALTKIRLLEKAVRIEKAKDFALRALAKRDGSKDHINYSELSDSEMQLMLNLAMCEHLRWNAAHEMLGYQNNTKGHSCDERLKMHNCLKDWQELDKETDAVDYIKDYKLYDFGVVETSFKLTYVEGE